MRRRQRPAGVDAERLASVDVDDWIEPAERVRLAEMVDEARRLYGTDPHAKSLLARVGPGVRYPALLIDEPAIALRRAEQMVVSYRRSMAGWEYAKATGMDKDEVCAKFGLGFVCSPNSTDDRYWLASGRIE